MKECEGQIEKWDGLKPEDTKAARKSIKKRDEIAKRLRNGFGENYMTSDRGIYIYIYIYII